MELIEKNNILLHNQEKDENIIENKMLRWDNRELREKCEGKKLQIPELRPILSAKEADQQILLEQVRKLEQKKLELTRNLNGSRHRFKDFVEGVSRFKQEKILQISRLKQLLHDKEADQQKLLEQVRKLEQKKLELTIENRELTLKFNNIWDMHQDLINAVSKEIRNRAERESQLTKSLEKKFAQTPEKAEWWSEMSLKEALERCETNLRGLKRYEKDEDSLKETLKIHKDKLSH